MPKKSFWCIGLLFGGDAISETKADRRTVFCVNSDAEADVGRVRFNSESAKVPKMHGESGNIQLRVDEMNRIVTVRESNGDGGEDSWAADRSRRKRERREEEETAKALVLRAANPIAHLTSPLLPSPITNTPHNHHTNLRRYHQHVIPNMGRNQYPPLKTAGDVTPRSSD